MKQYYTVVQPFLQENGRGLGEYLITQGIEYRLGAEFASEYNKSKFSFQSSDPLLKIYTILIDEYELSAIKLSVDEVEIVRNRPFMNFINAFRRCFSWFF